MQGDLEHLSEDIQEFILQRKVNNYAIMGSKIIAESKAVQLIEAKLMSHHHQKVILT
jgi:hypothetical protein